jgi:hypothetical protein
MWNLNSTVELGCTESQAPAGADGVLRLVQNGVVCKIRIGIGVHQKGLWDAANSKAVGFMSFAVALVLLGVLYAISMSGYVRGASCQNQSFSHLIAHV